MYEQQPTHLKERVMSKVYQCSICYRTRPARETIAYNGVVQCYDCARIIIKEVLEKIILKATGATHFEKEQVSND
jgi:ribosomal protein L37AE/L43A